MSKDDDPNLLTLSRADEKDEYATDAIKKRSQTKKGVQVKYFRQAGISNRPS